MATLKPKVSDSKLRVALAKNLLLATLRRGLGVSPSCKSRRKGRRVHELGDTQPLWPEGKLRGFGQLLANARGSRK